MLFILFQFDLFGEVIHISICHHTDITAFFGFFKHFDVLSLAPPYHRRQQLDLRVVRKLHDLIHHLVHGLTSNLFSTFGAVGNPYSGV